MPSTDTTSPLLSIRDLHVAFGRHGRRRPVLHGLSLNIRPGETLVVAGESGSGKSVTMSTIPRLIETVGGHIEQGEILYRDRNGNSVDITAADTATLRRLRGREIGLVAQDAGTALNPVHTVGSQIREALEIHGISRGKAAKSRARDLLQQVGLPEPDAALKRYPHQLSGGMKQRVMIAMALAPEPVLLLADEPTTALDVTIQAQILALLKDIQSDRGMAMLFITHDLAVASQIADRIAVLYAGRLCESADAHRLLTRPAHPYTQALLRAIPNLDSLTTPPHSIDGAPPDPDRMPSGCPFHPRCTRSRQDPCARAFPEPVLQDNGHITHCWFTE